MNDTINGQRVVIFSKAAGPTGSAYSADIDGEALSFSYRDSRFVDDQTGSQWNLAGQAIGGPLKGRQLPPLPSRYTFWFAYIAAMPSSDLYLP